MSTMNALFKASIATGVIVGSAVAYARLSDEQKDTIRRGVTRARRKLADLIAPNDGAYDLPKEVEEELAALINDN
mgnify:CR=1 FL=1|jgi:hypothetical protein